MVLVKLIVVLMWLLFLHACVGCGSYVVLVKLIVVLACVCMRVGCGSYVVLVRSCVGRLWFLCGSCYFMRVWFLCCSS